MKKRQTFKVKCFIALLFVSNAHGSIDLSPGDLKDELRRTRMDFVGAPSQQSFQRAMDTATQLAAALTAKTQESTRQFLDDIWESRGGRDDWQVGVQGMTWQEAEDGLMSSFGEEVRLWGAAAKDSMRELDTELDQRYGPFERPLDHQKKAASRELFSVDVDAPDDLGNLGGRRVDLLLNEALMDFMKDGLTTAQLDFDMIPPLWLWDELSRQQNVDGVDDAFWSNFRTLPVGMRNVLWTFDRPAVSESFCDMQRALYADMKRAVLEKGLDPQEELGHIAPFLSLLEMDSDVYKRSMDALKMHSLRFAVGDRPMVDVGAIQNASDSLLSTLFCLEEMTAFFWSVDRVLIAQEPGAQLATQLRTLWSPNADPMGSWPSFTIAKAVNDILQDRMTVFMGHMDTAGHSPLDFVDDSIAQDEAPDSDDDTDTDEEDFGDALWPHDAQHLPHPYPGSAA
ncbi:MAG: hypothetical protein C0514_01725 [Candidatus Puniceispirillum sp.]|nr:hypothetical protein [Candidatus Puniceispirillum sp.]